MRTLLTIVFEEELTLSQQISHRTIINPLAATVLACPYVHFGRSRRCPRSLAHAKHRSPHPDEIQRLAIHRREFEGRHVRECESHIQDKVHGRDECCTGANTG